MFYDLWAWSQVYKLLKIILKVLSIWYKHLQSIKVPSRKHGFPDSVDKHKYILYTIICLVQYHIRSFASSWLFRFEP